MALIPTFCCGWSPTPQKKLHQKYRVTSLARNDASTIGLQEIGNDLQGVNQEAPKSEKHKTHDNTQLSSPAPKECKQPNLHEPHTVSIANPFFHI